MLFAMNFEGVGVIQRTICPFFLKTNYQDTRTLIIIIIIIIIIINIYIAPLLFSAKRITMLQKGLDKK